MDIQRVTANSFLRAPGWSTGTAARADLDLDRLVPDVDLDERSRRSVELQPASPDESGDRRSWRPSDDPDDAGDAQAFVAFARSIFDVALGRGTDGARRAASSRGWSSRVDHVADAGLRRAAETLGVSGILSQDEVDRRFRDIVKSERPDLGTMTGERLDSLLTARATLTGHLQGVPWITGPRVPLGVGADLSA